MSITLNTKLRTDKADKKGYCPVFISIRSKGRESFYNTGIKVLPDNWNGQQITKGHANYDLFNAKISRLIRDAERRIINYELEGAELTILQVKEWLNPKGATGGDFLKYAAAVIEGKNEATKRRYTFELDKLKQYSKERLSFGQITPQWLSAYYKHLRKDVTHNTAINAFKVIRHTFNEARESKITTLYPFAEWKYPQYQAPKKKYLTMADCERLFDLLETDISEGMKLVTAFFLLECFSGIRVSDWSRFSVEKIVSNTDMILTTTKTGTEVRIPIDMMPSLRRIMDYITAGNLKYNKDYSYTRTILKEIGESSKLSVPLTTHVGRHTFATMWLSAGLSKTSIAKIMGITEKQLDTYAHFDNEKIRNEMRIIGGV